MQKQILILEKDRDDTASRWWNYGVISMLCDKGLREVFPEIENHSKIKLILSEKPINIDSRILGVFYTNVDKYTQIFDREYIIYKNNKVFENIGKITANLVKKICNNKPNNPKYICATVEIID